MGPSRAQRVLPLSTKASRALGEPVATFASGGEDDDVSSLHIRAMQEAVHQDAATALSKKHNHRRSRTRAAKSRVAMGTGAGKSRPAARTATPSRNSHRSRASTLDHPGRVQKKQKSRGHDSVAIAARQARAKERCTQSTEGG